MRKWYLIILIILIAVLISYFFYPHMSQFHSKNIEKTQSADGTINNDATPKNNNNPIQTKNPDGTINSRYGPFQVGIPYEQTLYVDVLSIDRGGPDGKTDLGLKVISEKEEVLYEQKYQPQEYEGFEFTPSQISLFGRGNLLELSCYSYPSAPSYGCTIQLFNINQQGAFVPVTAVLCPRASVNSELYSLEELTIGNQREPFVAAGIWTGYYMVIQYYPIQMEGGEQEKPCDVLEEYPVVVNEEYARHFQTSGVVTLFKSEGPPCFVDKQIEVREDSEIQFIGAKYYNGQWWLHVNIDGVDGMINQNHEELMTIGLMATS